MAATTVEVGLVLEGISVSFGGVQALSGVTLEFRPGEIHGLIGPNGAGKSTLFDVMIGLRRPDEGVVRLDGEDITTWSAARRARFGLRRTFQRPQVFGQLSVADNVLVATEWRGGGGGVMGDMLHLPARSRWEAERRARVEVVLDVCGLTDVAGFPAGRLPAGMARMVEVARAIVDDPPVLMLDEPTSGLDHTEAGRLRSVLDARRNAGHGVVLVEHDMAFVMEVCDRISVLDLGRVIAVGAPDEIRDAPSVRAAYLG